MLVGQSHDDNPAAHDPVGYNCVHHLFSVWVAHAKDMAPGNPCVSMSQALITARLDRGA